MSQTLDAPLPPLVALPSVVLETTIWPELEGVIEQELVDLVPTDRRWLTVASIHRSWLYEDSVSFPGVSPACLALLQAAGKAAVEVELRRAIAKAAPASDVSHRDQEANRVGRTVRGLLTSRLAITTRARLGAGEAAIARERGEAGGTSRTFDVVTMQVAGWWSLVAQGRHLRDFVEELYTQAAAAPSDTIEVRSTFQKHFGELDPQFVVEATGPEHFRVFVATVSTADGRDGTGEARNKKAAQQLACRDYLERHAPNLLIEARSIARTVPATARRPSKPLTDRRYVELAAAFGCRKEEPFARALIHQSWVYENVSRGDTDYDSYARLANLGSHVLIATMMRRRAALLLSQTTDPDPEVSIPISVPDMALRPIFDALGLGQLARVGGTHRNKPFPVEMIADMVQATLAASHIQWPDQATFERHLPSVVDQFLATQASISLIDPTTRLQQLAAELGFEWSETVSRTGPDHMATYRVRLSVSGLQAPVTADGSGSSLRAARSAAAEKFLTAAAILSGSSPEAPETARFLLLRQFDILAASRGRWPRWQRAGRLGLQMLLAKDLDAFQRWASRVEQIVGVEWRPDVATVDALADYYRPARRRPIFTTTLSRVTDWVTDAVREENSAASQDVLAQELIALAAAQSVWISTGEDPAVERIVEDWTLLNHRRLQVELDTELHGITTDPRTGAALFRGLQECASELSPLNEPRVLLKGRTSRQGCTIVIGCQDHSFAELADSVMMQLLCEAASGLSVYAPDRYAVGFNLKNHSRSVLSSWLTAAAFETDDVDAELARLIHDLKNEVTAARVAAGRPAASRIERLEADLAASRHMEEAAALASRLRDTDMLYAAADLFGSTDLSMFMQAYVSDLIRRLPPLIRIIPPAFAPVVVAIEGRALRAVLNDLVKNAQQAMMNGGEITLDYTASQTDDVALLRLADSGKGISIEVIEALAAGSPVASSKFDGSGLGLLGVRRILRRAGGDLEPVQRASGTGWLITLPLVSDQVEAPSA
jgi:dsRNA-specific ribonuclease